VTFTDGSSVVLQSVIDVTGGTSTSEPTGPPSTYGICLAPDGDPSRIMKRFMNGYEELNNLMMPITPGLIAMCLHVSSRGAVNILN
jgi:hypothetical protein